MSRELEPTGYGPTPTLLRRRVWGRAVVRVWGKPSDEPRADQPIAPRIWGSTDAGLAEEHTPPHNRPHEAWKLPLVAPARSAGSDRHRVELLAADDHGDQERSVRQAQQEDQPADRRLHHAPAADRRSAPALCSAWASLTGPRLGSPRHQARPSRSHHPLAIRRRPLRGLSRLDDGPARKRRTLPQRTPPPPPQSRRSKRCARERCADRAQRCRT